MNKGKHFNELRDAVKELRMMLKYHNKERIHSWYKNWNRIIKDIDTICEFDVNEDGTMKDKEQWLKENT